jgi:hypothetical protein
MPKHRNLFHVTIETGDIAMVPASHLKSETRTITGRVMAEMAQGRVASLPELPGNWQLTGGQEAGRCLSVMLSVEAAGAMRPVVWFGVARHSRCGAGLWSALHNVGTPSAKTNPERQPATPWLASRMMPDAAFVSPHVLTMLADLQECLAWEWILQADQEN